MSVKLVGSGKGHWFLGFTWSVYDRYTRALISLPALSLPFYFPLLLRSMVVHTVPVR